MSHQHKVRKEFHYTAFFEEASEGGYVVRIPTLGCVTEGETFEEAKAMAEDAIRCYLASLLKHGEPIPEEGPTEIVSILNVPMAVPSS
jgi:antitoxin HicB